MVNRETTNGIRVTAVSYYMGCKDNQQGKKYWVSEFAVFASYNVSKRMKESSSIPKTSKKK